jgi:hypothetical protein
MNWINRLEMKFGHLAIPGLLRYVAAMNALTFILATINPGYLEFLYLDRNLVLEGQVWRLITYLFVPTLGGLFPGWLAMAFYVIYLFWVGDGLERAWGAFRLNLFYLLGMLGTTVAALLANGDPSGFMLNTTLLFAFARFYPDTMIYIMFILPVKVKWLAWISAVLIFLSLLRSNLVEAAATGIALANFFLFFWREIYEEAKMRQEINTRRARFDREMRGAESDTLHRCKVCGISEVASPDAEFRVAADGEEYCTAHLPPR